jgi:hypothetical protein
MAANVIRIVISDMTETDSEINQGLNGTLCGTAVVVGVLSPQGIVVLGTIEKWTVLQLKGGQLRDSQMKFEPVQWQHN